MNAILPQIGTNFGDCILESAIVVRPAIQADPPAFSVLRKLIADVLWQLGRSADLEGDAARALLLRLIRDQRLSEAIQEVEQDRDGVFSPLGCHD